MNIKNWLCFILTSVVTMTLPTFRIIKLNAFLAEVKKSVPWIALIMYALRFTYSTYSIKFSQQQLKHIIMDPAAASPLSPALREADFRKPLIIWQTEITNDPKATVPKWYLKICWFFKINTWAWYKNKLT